MLPDNGTKHKIEVSIRAMEIDDVSAVYHLGEKLFTSDEFPILYRTWDPYEVTEYFTTESEYCLVAETEDDRIVGFVLANMVEKEGTAWKKYGYLTWIGVDEGFQRTNLGQRLYNKIEDTFQKKRRQDGDGGYRRGKPRGAGFPQRDGAFGAGTACLAGEDLAETEEEKERNGVKFGTVYQPSYAQ
jgi:GNAT superfamily N-acetyltransferase